MITFWLPAVIKNDTVVIKASVTEVDRKAEAAAQAKALAKQKAPYLNYEKKKKRHWIIMRKGKMYDYYYYFETR